ncbi:MAG: ubiquinol-cytochrome c reductase iron-sulfur subunit [Hyphomicrobiales bacterium]|nr:ubiquinol-cytochrome c reductase iron-sulfur subunit [Hyphomicrobiales bacterium]MDE2113385.1 ubiquinol-cytochrome c reductase iron-sulfur subunit [Hyphomicrobiales bacterium]
MSEALATEPTRRDMLYVATTAVAAVGVGGMLWPLVDQMNPDSATLSMATTEVDLTPIAVGQEITVKWQGKPLFVRHRTPKEIADVRAVPLTDLIDPETDEARVQKPEWLVVVGVCTHLGCTPNGYEGKFNGWLCPCHGSQYDASGRVRVGPAPLNLPVPKYVFTKPTSIVVG